MGITVCLAVHRAKNIAKQADVVAALTLEVLQGTTAAYDAGMFCNILTLLYHLVNFFRYTL